MNFNGKKLNTWTNIWTSFLSSIFCLMVGYLISNILSFIFIWINTGDFVWYLEFTSQFLRGYLVIGIISFIMFIIFSKEWDKDEN